jgi:hypothetical protein
MRNRSWFRAGCSLHAHIHHQRLKIGAVSASALTSSLSFKSIEIFSSEN